jgi:6,7-dimethyl-8-ribityllumazine synthase
VAAGCIRVRPDSVVIFFPEKTMNQPVHASAIQATDPRVPKKIAIVSACWHKSIVDNAVQAVKRHFAANEISAGDVDCFEVPGAFELPLHAKKLTETGRYEAIIACALVVNGGIYRHEFVASAVIDGLMQVQLDSGVPVFSAVLTPHNFHDSEEHLAFFANHFIAKGTEVAQACLATIGSLRNLARVSV